MFMIILKCMSALELLVNYIFLKIFLFGDVTSLVSSQLQLVFSRKLEVNFSVGSHLTRIGVMYKLYLFHVLVCIVMLNFTL